MRVLDLALKDLRQISRDRMAFVFLLLMPIVFTLMFGFAFAGADAATEADPRLPVILLDRDDGPLSAPLAALLADSNVIRLLTAAEAPQTQTALEDAVAAQELAAAIVVPDGYGSQMLAGHPLPLTLLAIPGSEAANTVQGAIQSALTRLTSAVRAATLSTTLYAERHGFDDAVARDSYFAAALQQGLLAWEEPPVTVAVTETGARPAGEETANRGGAYAQSSPGMMAQFAIAGLISAAQVLVLERKSRSLARLLTTAISRLQILLGHYLAMFLMIFAQLLLLMLFGQLVLGLDYFGEPLASLLLAGATATFAAGLGLLIGALAQTEEQVIIYAMIPMFLFAGVGGAWVPLELTPPAFQRVAYLTPVAWVMEGFKDILIRGQGLAAVLPAVGILLLYGLAGFLLGMWRFRFEGE